MAKPHKAKYTEPGVGCPNGHWTVYDCDGRSLGDFDSVTSLLAKYPGTEIWVDLSPKISALVKEEQRHRPGLGFQETAAALLREGLAAREAKQKAAKEHFELSVSTSFPLVQ